MNIRLMTTFTFNLKVSNNKQKINVLYCVHVDRHQIPWHSMHSGCQLLFLVIEKKTFSTKDSTKTRHFDIKI